MNCGILWMSTLPAKKDGGGIFYSGGGYRCDACNTIIGNCEVVKECKIIHHLFYILMLRI